MSLICGLDSSGKTASVCFLKDGAILYEKLLDEGLTHSETLLPLLMEAFAATGTGPKDVALYAVTGGPGSFTGLRIGMALVKGLALPCGTPAVQVPTLRALATACGQAGVVVPALDARRGEVYWAAFQGAAPVVRLHADTAGSADAAAAFACKQPDGAIFVGDGAKICYNACNCPLGVRLWPAQDGLNIARGAAQAAHARWHPGGKPPAAALRPNYLRLSQAERQRAQRSNDNGS